MGLPVEDGETGSILKFVSGAKATRLVAVVRVDPGTGDGGSEG